MNVYDFDKTIYKKDSSWAFYFYCLRRQPLLFRYWPRQGWAALRYALRCIDKTRMKQEFYCYFRGVADIDKKAETFWETKRDGIYPWYLAQKEEEDVVVSASPEFLLRPICRELGIGCLIASRVDVKTGKYTGKNCHGAEKVRRFREKFPFAEIDRFYSDSLSDTPLAEMAKESFLVRKGRVEPWKSERT